MVLLAAGIPLHPALAQENPPPAAKSTTLPPVKVEQHKPAKKPAAVKKEQPAAGRAAAGTQAGGSEARGSLGAENLPGRGDLSTAASALPAASTTIDARRLELAPVGTYGDIFLLTARFQRVASYGQGSLGYGLAMRGYTDTEHGRDIAYFIDGVPVNEISSISDAELR